MSTNLVAFLHSGEPSAQASGRMRQPVKFRLDQVMALSEFWKTLQNETSNHQRTEGDESYSKRITDRSGGNANAPEIQQGIPRLELTMGIGLILKRQESESGFETVIGELESGGSALLSGKVLVSSIWFVS